MSNPRNKKQNKNVFGNIITIINVIIVFRLLFLSVDIDYFRDDYGHLTVLGQNIKHCQIITEKVTNPIIEPVKAIILSFLNNADSELVGIMAPIFTIVFLVMLALVVKLAMPYINFYLDKKENL